MTFTSPVFDLEFQGEFGLEGIKITSAKKIHAPEIIPVFHTNLETRPVEVGNETRYHIVLDGEYTEWHGDYTYASLIECQIEMSSFCLKQIAFLLANEIQLHLEIDTLTR